jgi:hypothetical protein
MVALSLRQRYWPYPITATITVRPDISTTRPLAVRGLLPGLCVDVLCGRSLGTQLSDRGQGLDPD